jgi:hypothetical protein
MHVFAEAVGMMLLEKAFPLAAARAAQQRQRAIDQLRQQPLRHTAVIVGDIALGVGGAVEHDALGMGDARIVACPVLLHR